MTLNIPYQLRAAIYVFTAVGTPVVAYLLSVGIIGELEVALWSAEVAVASSLAALNISPAADAINKASTDAAIEEAQSNAKGVEINLVSEDQL